MSKKDPTVWNSLVCVGGVLLIVVAGVLFSDVEVHILLLAALSWAGLNTTLLGYPFRNIKRLMNDGLAQGLTAVYIFILIGVVIACLIESGALATLVYYALNVVSPGWFLPAVLLVCSFMSIATGTSWGTVGTVGVILVGVGAVLNVPLPVVAGAVISGAIFGDKMSPLSDTTILASSCAGTDVYSHIRSMAMTTGPSFLVALVLYGLVGLRYSGMAIPTEEIDLVQTALASEFTIGFIPLLPIVVILTLSLAKFSAEPSLVAGSLVAIVIAVFVQNQDLGTVLHSVQFGHTSDSDVEAVNILLNRGGIQSMMWSLSLCLIALALGGVLNGVGFLRVLMHRVIERVTSVAKLVATTIVTCFAANLSMAENYLSIIFGAQIFKEAFTKRGLRMSMLSRSVEEGATLTAGLIPWTSAGAFFAGSLGIATVDYAPWVFLSFINIAVSIGMALFGVGVLRVDEASRE